MRNLARLASATLAAMLAGTFLLSSGHAGPAAHPVQALALIVDSTSCSTARATVLVSMPHGLQWGALHAQGPQAVDWTVSFHSGGAVTSESFMTLIRDMAFVSHDDRGHVVVVRASACLASAPDAGSTFQFVAALSHGP